MNKKWQIMHETPKSVTPNDIIAVLLSNRGMETKADVEQFLHPKNPLELTPADVEIDKKQLATALKRIQKAIKNKESIVVYSDYDADGITAGAVMWETLHELGATVMPYIPHRAEEGYGLSTKGIDAVREQFNPTLIITVDHGITAKEKVEYAKSLGIEVIVTDHHVKPEELPDCTIVHTTKLCGAGVSWFVSKELFALAAIPQNSFQTELLALAAIGTVADLVSLTGANRSIVKHGLASINKTKRVGLVALIADAGLEFGKISTYDISHVIAPRINAMGRLVHALDALRLLCARKEDKAKALAQQLGLTNKERQTLTQDSAAHAKEIVAERAKETLPKLLFVAHDTYNQGVIGLIAGKLVEEYYRPAIVVAQGPEISKASARSVTGFNIVEAIRSCKDILIDVGGHPMAAGFTVETKNLDLLKSRLEEHVEKTLSEDLLTRVLPIDMEIPISMVNESLWMSLTDFEPFGFGSPQPVFSSHNVRAHDTRLVGAEGKHLKLKLQDENRVELNAIGFGMGKLEPELTPDIPISVAYNIDMNYWNGRKYLQIKLKDIHLA